MAVICLGWLGLSAVAQDAPAPQEKAMVEQLQQEMKQSAQRIDALQKELDAKQPGAGFQQQLDTERQHLQALRKELDTVAAAPAKSNLAVGEGPETAARAKSGFIPADIYNDGFFVSTKDKSYSLYINGLFQVRFTGFKPHSGIESLGESSKGTANFDVFLGRLAISGSVVRPSLKYFLQLQGSTAGNSNTISMLDWFASDTFSKYLTVQVGRAWTPYTYEYYDNPGNYLFADLSTAEYAFVLPRAIGVQAYGHAGKLSYAGMVSNNIPALDAGGQENVDTKLAYLGHVQYDVLAPYGYVETDPSGSAKQQLTLWGSVAYNPVENSSGFENLTAGDTTKNATATAAYRYKLFTLQTTGYFRKTHPGSGAPSNNSWGYGEQAGFYLVPKKFEFAQRISGVNWGAEDYGAGSAVAVGSSLPVENTWYVGPGFPYHRIGEDSAGLNYYLHGHNAKVQMSYSYLHGNTFTGRTFAASRVWIQTQIMF
ncbi:MAG: hypothetical protein HIU93_14120 [Acidobacteria bacterium]|nr:hypothetical protein [Acidobacteriota bacterium]MBW4045900.1 hypothetical protein [Acidobacteriota bacterium]